MRTVLEVDNFWNYVVFLKFTKVFLSCLLQQDLITDLTFSSLWKLATNKVGYDWSWLQKGKKKYDSCQ